MKRFLRQLLTVLFALTIFLSSITIKANAITYPLLYFCNTDAFDDYTRDVYVSIGKEYCIRINWISSFSYEGYDLVVYDPSGQKVSRASSTWENKSVIRHITVKWTTKGRKAGKYTVEVTPKFYSLYRWNDAPKKEYLTIHLEQANKKPDKITDWSVKRKSSSSFTVTYVMPNRAQKGEIQYSTDKSLKKNVKKKITTQTTLISINKLTKGKTYYVRVRGINGKFYGAWSAKKKIKLKS